MKCITSGLWSLDVFIFKTLQRKMRQQMLYFCLIIFHTQKNLHQRKINNINWPRHYGIENVSICKVIDRSSQSWSWNLEYELSLFI